MAGLIDKILTAGAEAAVRGALTTFLDGEVAKGLLTKTQASYIEEGAVDAVGLGLREWQAKKPST